MKRSSYTTFLLVSAAAAQTQTIYGQCGGIGWTGPTICPTADPCSSVNSYYYQCLPASSTVPASTTSSPPAATTSKPSAANTGTQTIYGQCGGIGWTGPTICPTADPCSFVNSYYYQCLPVSSTQTSQANPTTTTARTSQSSIPVSTTTTTAKTSTVVSSTSTKSSASSSSAPTTANASTQTIYGQCGGIGWTGPTLCPTADPCSSVNSYYYQCLPISTTVLTSTTQPPPATSTSKPSVSSTTKSSVSSTTSAAGGGTGIVQVAGVNIAGCDFGCSTDGTCVPSNAYCPSSTGPSQMQHFASSDGLNIFRLPVGWQSLVANNLGGPLDPTFMSTYDAIVQSCLSTGARCIIDVHNYARWNGGIIGQGGPTNSQFASLWSQLASKYAASTKVVFGIMNEPHDMPDMNVWAASVQAAVTAIRNAGATTQWILLPGNSYTSATAFPTASGPYLAGISNLDGSKTNLFYDVHQYYDSDGSGTSTTCVTNHISDAFQPLATYLRQNGRQALLSETGGGNNDGCVGYVCAALSFLNANNDVFLGWVGWAAGSFDSSYALSEVPVNGVDTQLVQSCIAGKF